VEGKKDSREKTVANGWRLNSAIVTCVSLFADMHHCEVEIRIMTADMHHCEVEIRIMTADIYGSQEPAAV
jgi:hypothetical protein